jgi:flagellar basal-body rod modification protein FlgD
MISKAAPITAGQPGLASAVSGGGKLGKDEFLKMLVAQLKNQDPLQPSNGQELAAQLAHFSTVEQLSQIKDLLAGQGSHVTALASAISTGGAQSLLGSTVEAPGDLVFVPSEGAASVRVLVGGAGGAATLRLFDDKGRELGSRQLGSMPGGEQVIELGSLSSGLRQGWYSYSVDVVDSDGSRVPTQTFTAATVDGVRFGASGPLLTSGELLIPYEAISRVAR